ALSFPTIKFRQMTLFCHPVTWRIHVRNAAQAIIDSANNAAAADSARRADPLASIAKNTAPIAATPAALAICAVVPYMPEPAPALATVASTTSGARYRRELRRSDAWKPTSLGIACIG